MIRGKKNQLERFGYFPGDEEGASGVEYGIMLAAVAAVIIAIALSMGGKVQGLFTRLDIIF